MTARSSWREGSSMTKEVKEDDTITMTSEMTRINFESSRHNVDRNMSLDRQVIGYKIRIVSEPICNDELVKNYDYKNML